MRKQNDVRWAEQVFEESKDEAKRLRLKAVKAGQKILHCSRYSYNLCRLYSAQITV